MTNFSARPIGSAIIIRLRRKSVHSPGKIFLKRMADAQVEAIADDLFGRRCPAVLRSVWSERSSCAWIHAPSRTYFRARLARSRIGMRHRPLQSRRGAAPLV